jgi:hypothetical protein
MPAVGHDVKARAITAPQGAQSHSEVADRLRVLASEAKSPETRKQLIDLAALFEKLAAQAARFGNTYVLAAPKAS